MSFASVPIATDLHGNRLTRELLPRPGLRWVINRKAIVVRLIDAGLMTHEEIRKIHDIYLHELKKWRAEVAAYCAQHNSAFA